MFFAEELLTSGVHVPPHDHGLFAPSKKVIRVTIQYLVLHRTHRGASWASGAAQAAQLVMSILVYGAVSRGSPRCTLT